MCHSSVVVAAALIIANTLFAVEPTSRNGEDTNMQVLGVVEEGCRANRAVISRFKCDSTFEYGESDTWERAMRGDGTIHATAKGSYATDGVSERFDVSYPRELTLANETSTGNGSSKTSRYESIQLQVLKGRQFLYFPIRSSGNVRKAEIQQAAGIVRPFDAGIAAFGKADRTTIGLIESTRAGELSFSYLGEAEHEGVNCWGLRFEDSKSNIAYENWVAPERGFQSLTIKATRLGTQDILFVVRYNEHAKVDRCWLPKSVHVAFPVRPKDGPETYRFRRIVFRGETISVTHDDITFTLPQDAVVFDTFANVQWSVSKDGFCPGGVFDFQAYSETDVLGRLNTSPLRQIDSIAAGSKVPSSPRSVILLIVNILIIAVIAFVVYRGIVKRV